MTRALFLGLSQNAGLRQFSSRFGPARRAAFRFVAGETPDEAIAAIRTLNAKDILTTVDMLGENVHTPEDAARARDGYLLILDKMAQNGIKSSAALKLTQFGLDIDAELCRANVAAILQRAQTLGTRVRLDMESTAYTDRTITMLRALRKDYNNVGIVIQAYLYRSEADIRALIAEGTNIRLCKGAYQEPADKAFPRKADTDANMVKLMELMLASESRAQGAYLAMATHDEKMIAATKRYVAAHNVPRDAFEFQMLYGIRRDLQEQLAREGYRMRVYVPYGAEWFPYFMRRLAERPANVWFILGNLLKP